MKVSLNWLTDYVDISMSADELGELFTRIGLGCEGIDRTPTDIIFDLEVTSNRPDLLGHIGVAREIAAATGAAFNPPTPDPAKAGKTAAKVEDFTSVEVLDPDSCPRYTARVVRNVKVGPSPSWMLERLEAMGLRSINNVVDVTNYVLFEYSQPLHCFDYDKLTANRIVVRRAKDGEILTSIDETKCHLDDSMLIIADAEKPVAIAGVMGGLNTEVGLETTDVLIESAQFDPLSVRRTSRKLMLMSESNYRFERGVDPVGVNTASMRACELILQLAGGELAEGVVDVWAEPYAPHTVTLRPKRTNLLLGIDVPSKKQVEILDNLALRPDSSGGIITCTIPSHRADLTREADLIEEVARVVGYDRIPVADKVLHKVLPEAPNERIRRQAAQVLAAGGFDEAITPTFIDASEAALFGVNQTVRVDPLTRKTNNTLRPTLLASLLRACKTNQDAGNTEVSLFELANVFSRPSGGQLPTETAELALVTTRRLRDLRGTVEALVGTIAPQTPLAARKNKVAGMDETTAAQLLMDGQDIGGIGLISPEAQDYYALQQNIAAATIRFDALLDRGGARRTYRPIPKTPPVRRDLSLIVDEEVTWEQLSGALEAVEQPLRVGLEYVTTYRGDPIPPDRKSVTVTLTYRREGETLRGEQVDEQIQQVLAAMKSAFGAELRQ